MVQVVIMIFFCMQRDDVIIFKEISEIFISLSCDHLGLFEFNCFINELCQSLGWVVSKVDENFMILCILFPTANPHGWFFFFFNPIFPQKGNLFPYIVQVANTWCVCSLLFCLNFRSYMTRSRKSIQIQITAEDSPSKWFLHRTSVKIANI